MSRHHKVRTCRGKVRYRDHAEAVRALRRIAKQNIDRPQRRTPVRPYECDRCHGWHITAQASPPPGR